MFKVNDKNTRTTGVFIVNLKHISDLFLVFLFSILSFFFFLYFLNFSFVQFNPLLANIPILYPPKTPENQRFSGVFRGYEMGILASNRLKNCIPSQKETRYENVALKKDVFTIVMTVVKVTANISLFIKAINRSRPNTGRRETRPS